MDLITQTGLLIASPILIYPAIIIGFLLNKKKIFGQLLILVAFIAVYNFYLKSLWQIPLEGIGKAQWAFPSGHMHLAIAFWGWLALQFNNRYFKILSIVLLSFAGFSIVKAGYHSPIDIYGAVFFGVLSLWIYSLLYKIPVFNKKPPLLGILLAGINFVLLSLIPINAHTYGIWQAQSVLVIFSFGWLIGMPRKEIPPKACKQAFDPL